ncbi:MAG: MoaD/ThiS family protein [Actinobacteria bacterium]|nr:MoaD/ThiS family protein [Actinomycetota bacterium]
MQIKLVLFGHLDRYLPAPAERGAVILDVPTHATVAGVLDDIGVPQKERGYVTVNGERAAPDRRLEEGDEVRVIVPLGGG